MSVHLLSVDVEADVVDIVLHVRFSLCDLSISRDFFFASLRIRLRSLRCQIGFVNVYFGVHFALVYQFFLSIFPCKLTSPICKSVLWHFVLIYCHFRNATKSVKILKEVAMRKHVWKNLMHAKNRMSQTRNAYVCVR